MKYKTNKQKKLEDSRFSVFTDNLEECIVCEKCKDDINEIFMGSDRSNSIIYGFCIPLCRTCHDEFHDNIKMQQLWIRRCKEYFINNYGTEEEFIKIFHPKIR